MIEVETLEKTDTLRVRLVVDEDCEDPRDTTDCWVSHRVTYNDAYDGRWHRNDNAGPLIGVYQEFYGRHGRGRTHGRYGYADLFARYVSIFGDGVAVVDGTEVWYAIYDEDWRMHEERGGGTLLACVEAERKEWTEWAMGEVYGYLVEELTTWRRATRTTDDPECLDEREEWETVDSCFGLIGYEYAASEARERYEQARQERSS